MPKRKQYDQNRGTAKERTNNVLRSNLDHVDDVKAFASSYIALSKERCVFLIRWIHESYDVHLFSDPVDWKGLQLYDYPACIHEPMDLSTLFTYTMSEKFLFSEWLRKSRLIWTNAMTYNPRSNMVHLIAKRLYTLFEEKLIQEQKSVEDDNPERLRDV